MKENYEELRKELFAYKLVDYVKVYELSKTLLKKLDAIGIFKIMEGDLSKSDVESLQFLINIANKIFDSGDVILPVIEMVKNIYYYQNTLGLIKRSNYF